MSIETNNACPDNFGVVWIRLDNKPVKIYVYNIINAT